MKRETESELQFANEHVIVLHHRLIGDFNNARGLAEAIGEKLGVPVVVREIRSRSRLMGPLLRVLFGIMRKLRSKTFNRILFHLFFDVNDKHGLVPSTICVVSTLGAGEVPNAFYSAATGAIGVHLGRPKRIPHAAFDLVIAHQGHEPIGCELALPISPSQIRRNSFPSNDSRTSLLVAIGGNAEDACFPDSFWPELTERAIKVAQLIGRECLVTTSPRTGTALEALIETRIDQLAFQPSQLVIYGRGERTTMEELLQTSELVIVSAESVSMISAAIASGARVAAAYWQKPPVSPRISSFLRQQRDARRLVLWDLSRCNAPDFDSVIPMEVCWSEVLWQTLAKVFAERRRRVT